MFLKCFNQIRFYNILVEMSAFTQAVILYAALISSFLYTAFNDWFSKGKNGCFL